MESENNSKYINKFVKIYPYLKGFTDDLLFFIAIDTLFFTTQKGLSEQQIVMLTTISSIFSIVFRLLLIKVIERIGNTKSVRLGMILLLFSAIFITFGKSYFVLALGKIVYEIAWVFKDMENVMLKNNLSVIGKSDFYAKIAGKGMTIYAFLTFIVSLTSGVLFNKDPHLPMYLCIVICLIATVMYFYMKDVSSSNVTKRVKRNNKINLPSIIWSILISYCIFYGIISASQTNSKLLIQYELSDVYDISKVSIYLSIIVAFSRVARLASNIIFHKVYSKIKDKSIIILSSMLFSAFIFIILGYFIDIEVIKFVMMSIGFCIILGVRDPFRLYIQDTILKLASKEDSQAAMSYMQFARKIGTTICSLVISAVLLKWSMIYVMFGIGALALIEIFVNIKLYKILSCKN